MIVLLAMIGALFLVAGMASGLVSVYRGSKLRYLLLEEHGEAPDSDNLWKYIKGREGDEVPGILEHKNRIKKSFMWFCISSLMGIASFLTALVIFLVS